MAKTLRGKQPTLVVPSKPKILVFGKGGVGKTYWACHFPRVYFIDTEGGGSRPQYKRLLEGSGGAYMGKDEGSQDFLTVVDEVRTLATTDHPYLTLAIDSFTQLYLLAAAMAEARVGSDFGKDKKEANKPTRQLLLWLERLDMNVILICHRKANWTKHGKELVQEGFTFDGWEKMEYLLDLSVEVMHDKGRRTGIVRKTRYEELPLDSTFDWTFETFAKKVGEETITRAGTVFQAATQEQVSQITKLVALLKMDDSWVEGCWSKAGVQGWDEMAADKAAAVLDWLKKKIEVKE